MGRQFDPRFGLNMPSVCWQVLYFPKDWPHYTEALPPAPGTPATPSFSVGFRMDGGFLM